MKIADQLRRAGFPAHMIAGAIVDGKPLAEVEGVTAGRSVEFVIVKPGNPIRIIISGTPIGKPRMSQRDKWKKRPAVVRYRGWCDRVRAAVGDCLPAPDRILELNWKAYFEPPVSWSKAKRIAAIGEIHRSNPDRDNIDKAVLDCLFKQDSAIGVGRIEKRWDWKARLEVEILVSDFF